MTRNKYLLSLLTAILLIHGCELDNSMEAGLPEGDPFPIVEAYLEEGEPFQILVSASNTLQEPVRINMVWNASVHIICENDSVKLKNLIRVDRDRNYLYNYLSDSLVSARESGFELLIESEEYPTIRASCHSVGKVEIEDIILDETMILEVLSRNLEDPSGNYYQLRCMEYSGGEIADIHQIEFDKHEESEGSIKLIYPLPANTFDSLRIDLYRIDSAAYEYHRSLSNALKANRDPFTPPTPFQGNLTNAWGLFTFVTRDSRTVLF